MPSAAGGEQLHGHAAQARLARLLDAVAIIDPQPVADGAVPVLPSVSLGGAQLKPKSAYMASSPAVHRQGVGIGLVGIVG